MGFKIKKREIKSCPFNYPGLEKSWILEQGWGWSRAFPDILMLKKDHSSFSKTRNTLGRDGDGLGPEPWGSFGFRSWEPNSAHSMGLWLSVPRPLWAQTVILLDILCSPCVTLSDKLPADFTHFLPLKTVYKILYWWMSLLCIRRSLCKMSWCQTFLYSSLSSHLLATSHLRPCHWRITYWSRSTHNYHGNKPG